MTQPFYAAYINLDRAVSRRAFMEGQLAAAGVIATSVSAVDRAAPGFMPRGGLRVVRDDVLIETNWDGRVYVLGEDACFQSHLLALKGFLETAEPFALILEDDAEFAPDFSAVVASAISKAGQWDMIKLEGLRSKGSRPALRVADLAPPYALVASLSPAAGAAATLYSRAAAERVIAAAEGDFEPYDNLLASLWRHRLRVLDVSPFPVRQGLAESSRADARPKIKRSASQALRRWWLHLTADLVGQHARRWGAQFRRFGGVPTLAPWARRWPADVAAKPPLP
jgi:glycosyl transferase family 25